MERYERSEDETIHFPEDLEHLELALLNLEEAIETLAKWAGIDTVETIAMPDLADRWVNRS